MRRWLVAALVLLLNRRRRRTEPPRERLVAEAPPNPRSELAVLVLLALGTAASIAFIVVYALDRPTHQTQLLGLSLGLAFAFLSAAAIVFGRRLVPEEHRAEPYPEPEDHAVEQRAALQIVEESGDRITRRRLLKLAAGGSAAAVGTALVVPALALGPFLDTDPLRRVPWWRGVRLVDSRGRVLRADDIVDATFYTAFPAGAYREQLGAPVVLVRVDLDVLQLPNDRDGWAPEGIVAYSKICTHAGCAVSLYRVPHIFPPTAPSRPALICPCHYSTFDPARGAEVLFGPAGRPLPQLPLEIARDGALVAAGGFSGPVGPSWWGVRQ